MPLECGGGGGDRRGMWGLVGLVEGWVGGGGGDGRGMWRLGGLVEGWMGVGGWRVMPFSFTTSLIYHFFRSRRIKSVF